MATRRGVKPPEGSGPKKVTGGNTRADIAWLEAVRDELQTPDLQAKPKDFFDDVLFQWQGYADELNDEFFLEFLRGGQRRCNGTAYVRDERGGYIIDLDWNRLRRPCLASPGRGMDVCRTHGGAVPTVKAAAERALANASEVVALRLVGMTTGDVEDKVKLAAMNSVLDRAGIKGGTVLEVQVPGYQKVMAEMFGEPSVEDESA